MTKEWLVEFGINIDADNPQEAARRAWNMLTDPSSMQPVAGVTGEDGEVVLVDLHELGDLTL